MTDTIQVPDKATRDNWTLFQQIARYNEAFKSPTLKSDGLDSLKLGKSLIEEEILKELLPQLEKYQSFPSLDNLNLLCDSLVDGVVVILFLAHQLGLPFDTMWKKVQDTQWAKIWPDGKVHRQGPTDTKPGKIIKPDGWVEPDFMEELIEWNSKMRGEFYRGGLIQHESK